MDGLILPYDSVFFNKQKSLYLAPLGVPNSNNLNHSPDIKVIGDCFGLLLLL